MNRNLPLTAINNSNPYFSLHQIFVRKHVGCWLSGLNSHCVTGSVNLLSINNTDLIPATTIRYFIK